MRPVSVGLLLSLLAAAAVLPLAGLLAFITVKLREEDVDGARLAIRALADQTAIHAANAIGDARRLARHLAGRPLIRNLEPGRCDPELANLRALNPHYTNLGSVDATGRVICSLLVPDSDPRPNIGNPPWLVAMRQDRKPAIGQPQRGLFTGSWIVVVAEPLLDDSRALRGAAQVVIRLAAFQGPGSGPLLPGAITGIVSTSGRVIARSSDPDAWAGRDVSQLPVGRAIAQGKLETGYINGLDGDERLYAFAPVHGTDWVAFAGVPTERVFHEAQLQAWRNGVAAFAVLMLAALLVWRIHRRIAAPLADLERVASAVAGGDMARRATPAGTAETVAVALTFNRMLDLIPEIEGRLRTSEDSYRLLFESSPDAIRVICDDRIVMINPAGQRLLGLDSQAQIVGIDVFSTIRADNHAPVRAAYRRVLEDGETVHYPELVFRRNDGVEVAAEVIMLPITYEGKPAILSISRDLTARRESERRLRKLAEIREALGKINNAIARSTTDWRALCEIACRIIVAHGGVVSAAIRVRDASGHSLESVALEGPYIGRAGHKPIPLTEESHPVVRAYREGVASVIDDILAEPALAASHASAREHGLNSALMTPMRAAAGTVGILLVFAAERGHFDPELADLLGEIAGNLAFAHGKLAAETDLRESEERFRTLTVMSADWYWETDGDHRFVRISSSLHTGPDSLFTESLIGKVRWESGASAIDDEAMREHRETLERHLPFRDFELHRVDSHGRTHYALTSGDPMFDAAGRFTGYHGVGHGITRRKEAELRIQRLASLKEALSRTSIAIVRERDWQRLCEEVCRIAADRSEIESARIRLFNPQTGALEEIAHHDGQSNLPPLPDVLADDASLAPARVYRSGEPLVLNDADAIVDALARSSLAVRGVRSTATLPIVADGAVVATLGVFAYERNYFDDELVRVLAEIAANLGFAHAKRRSETALVDAETRYRLLVETSQSGVILLHGCRIEYANPAFARMFDFAVPAAAVGTDIRDLVLPEYREAVAVNLQRLVDGEVDALPGELVRMRSREERPLVAQASATALRLHDRLLVQTELRDVTREHTALAEVRALNRTLEERVARRTAELTEANHDLESFAYSVAHDLRAPLRTMSGFAQLMRLDLEEGETGKLTDHVDRIVTGTQRMGALIDGLLRVARVSREVPVPEEVDLGRMIEEVLTEQQARAQARVQVGALPVVRADAAMMLQAWTNLISNAVKYSAKTAEPAIAIDCERVADEIVIRVRDNGAGFNPAEAHLLFGVFQRLHSAREFEGTGVGLAIVRRIIERHGGHVQAEGRPGVGATFFVYLPAALIVDAGGASRNGSTLRARS